MNPPLSLKDLLLGEYVEYVRDSQKIFQPVRNLKIIVTGSIACRKMEFMDNLCTVIAEDPGGHVRCLRNYGKSIWKSEGLLNFIGKLVPDPEALDSNRTFVRGDERGNCREKNAENSKSKEQKQEEQSVPIKNFDDAQSTQSSTEQKDEFEFVRPASVITTERYGKFEKKIEFSNFTGNVKRLNICRGIGESVVNNVSTSNSNTTEKEQFCKNAVEDEDEDEHHQQEQQEQLIDEGKPPKQSKVSHRDSRRCSATAGSKLMSPTSSSILKKGISTTNIKPLTLEKATTVPATMTADEIQSRVLLNIGEITEIQNTLKACEESPIWGEATSFLEIKGENDKEKEKEKEKEKRTEMKYSESTSLFPSSKSVIQQEFQDEYATKVVASPKKNVDRVPRECCLMEVTTSTDNPDIKNFIDVVSTQDDDNDNENNDDDETLLKKANAVDASRNVIRTPHECCLMEENNPSKHLKVKPDVETFGYSACTNNDDGDGDGDEKSKSFFDKLGATLSAIAVRNALEKKDLDFTPTNCKALVKICNGRKSPVVEQDKAKQKLEKEKETKKKEKIKRSLVWKDKGKVSSRASSIFRKQIKKTVDEDLNINDYRNNQQNVRSALCHEERQYEVDLSMGIKNLVIMSLRSVVDSDLFETAVSSYNRRYEIIPNYFSKNKTTFHNNRQRILPQSDEFSREKKELFGTAVVILICESDQSLDVIRKRNCESEQNILKDDGRFLKHYLGYYNENVKRSYVESFPEAFIQQININVSENLQFQAKHVWNEIKTYFNDSQKK